jgi:DNA-binding Xre family transcriptional regulator
MAVSYNRLWKLLIDKNMKKIEMQYATGISGNILARMGKNQYIALETVEKICKTLDCTVDEMLEFTEDEAR